MILLFLKIEKRKQDNIDVGHHAFLNIALASISYKMLISIPDIIRICSRSWITLVCFRVYHIKIRGDTAFRSVECRYRQISINEQQKKCRSGVMSVQANIHQ
ncbi:hypothetical protein ACS0TY_013838 [Phlomoides rotata]